jgi:hypothetical protein
VVEYTRRGALALIAGGSAMLLVGSDGSPDTEAERVAAVNIAADGSAFLTLSGLEQGKTYDEPHEVTLTNSLGKDLDGTNLISTDAGDLELRDSASGGSSQTLNPGPLADGNSYTFEVVLATGESGDVTDDVVLDLDSSDGDSVTVDRTITVNQKTSGRLVYGRSADLKVYNAVQDNETDPPDSNSVEVIGANAADVVGDGNVDIPYADSTGMYVTSVSASSDTQIFSESSFTPGIKTQKTRLSVGKWPPATLSGNLILFAVENNTNRIYAADGNGNTEEILKTGNGVGGVSGVADIDGDGKVEMVFVDSSQQLRYLNQDGSTQKISNGGVGSNNSAGFGPPADFTDNGNPRIPFIDGSQNPALVTAGGNKTILNSSGIAKKAAVAPVDVDGDDELEFLFLGNSSGKIRWLDDVGGSNTPKGPLTVDIDNDATGEEIVPDEKLGLNSGVDLQ